MSILRTLRKSFASAAAFALIAVSPGLAPYEALAQVRSVPVEAVPALQAPLGSPALEGVLPSGGLSTPLSQDPGSLGQLGTGTLEAAPSDASSARVTESAALAPQGARLPAGRQAVGRELAAPRSLERPAAAREARRLEETGSAEEASPAIGRLFDLSIERTAGLETPSSALLAAPESKGAPKPAGESRTQKARTFGFATNTPPKKVYAIGGAVAGGLVLLQLLGGRPLFDIVNHVAGVALGMLVVTLPSLAFHEWAHAKTADKLGDKTPRFQGRLTLNPLKHVDPLGTVVLPAILMLLGGAPFGWAKPVNYNPGNFTNAQARSRGTLLVKLAGPAANLALAVAGAAAYRLSSPLAGAYGLIPAVFAVLVDVNLLLAVFNMIPIPPADGHELFRRTPVVGQWLDRIPPNIGLWLGYALFWFPMTKAILYGIVGILHYFLVSAPLFGTNLAASWLPAMALAGTLMPIGPLGDKQPPAPRPQAAPPAPAVDLIVQLPEGRSLTQDVVPNLFDPNQPKSARLYRAARESMRLDLERAGLDEAALARFGADPQSSFRRIRAVTLRVGAGKEALLKTELESKGFKVWPNAIIRLPKPIEPEASPDRKVVNTDELLDILNARPVHKKLEDRLGSPALYGLSGFSGRLAKLLLKLGGVSNPRIKIGSIDSGVDENASPALKRAVSKKLNATSGENVDDIGHGTHTTDTALALDPWQNDVTMIKGFVDGGATTEDLLKALTMAGNEDLLVIGNSWGDSSGDPNSPLSQMVTALAKEGRILVFAAGNEGPGKNTIGAPAIVVYKSPETGAPRVISVAAADYRKVIASFSSRGEGSEITKDMPGYPLRPDVTAMGVDLEASVPGGRKQVMSGTSMATPDVWGEISLHARVRGVTTVGKELDQIGKDVVESSVDTGQPDYAQGRGFRNVHAADQALDAAGLSASKPLVPRGLRRLALRGAAALAAAEDGTVKKAVLAAGIAAFAALAWAAIHILGSLGLGMGPSDRLPPAESLYGDALLEARNAARQKGFDPDALEFLRATGSSEPRTMQWNYEFSLPGPNGSRSILVRFLRSAAGGFLRSTYVGTPAPAKAPATVAGLTPKAMSLDPGILRSRVRETPDSALGLVQRQAPGFSADTLSFELLEDPATGDVWPYYVLHSPQGVRAVVQANSGRLLEPARDAAKAPDEVEAFRHVLFSMRLRAELQLGNKTTPREAGRAIAAQADDLASFFERASSKNPASAQAVRDIRSVLDRLGAKAQALAASAPSMDAYRTAVRKTLDALQSTAANASTREKLLEGFDAELGAAGSSSSSSLLGSSRLESLGKGLIILAILGFAVTMVYMMGHAAAEFFAPANDPANWLDDGPAPPPGPGE